MYILFTMQPLRSQYSSAPVEYNLTTHKQQSASRIIQEDYYYQAREIEEDINEPISMEKSINDQ